MKLERWAGWEGLILDVGSGYAPDPRATVLLDKFLEGDDTSRYTGKLRTRPRQPLICGDIEAMPFMDKAFDIVLCYQTLEHVENPERACAELNRVCKAGFITAPSEDATREDITHGRRLYHKWLIKQMPHSTYGTRLEFYPRELVPQLPVMQCPDRHVIMFWVDHFKCVVHEEL